MRASGKVAAQVLKRGLLENNSTAPAVCATQSRLHGGGVPEFFGRPSHYTEGTDFLGTPQDHLKRVATRPLSPHVMEIDGKQLHYKMPINAISSIMNRATGCALSVGMIGAGFVALTGDLPGTIAGLRDSAPSLMLPLKAAVSFPFVYHYAGGLRHIIWDKHSIGNQADKTSLLENPAVDKSSQLIIGVSVVGSVGLALLSTS